MNCTETILTVEERIVQAAAYMDREHMALLHVRLAPDDFVTLFNELGARVKYHGYDLDVSTPYGNVLVSLASR